MVARIDKVVQLVRAMAGTAIAPGAQTVKLNSGGSVVLAGTADALGVVCPGGTIALGAPIGILIRGEIADFGGTAATSYYSGASGSIGTAVQTSRVGWTVEGNRLVVNM